MPGQMAAQLFLIQSVLQEGFGVGFVVGKGEGIGQIMGQLAKRVVLPDVPAFLPAQPPDPAMDIAAGVGKIMSHQESPVPGTLQIGQRIAVRLKGAEQKGQSKALFFKTFRMRQQGAGQKSVTSFLQEKTSGVRIGNAVSVP